MFIPQVTKLKDGKDYPGKTLYKMIVSIQKYLNQNNMPWKLIEGPEFINVRTVLDNVMKDRAQRNIGLVRKQAEYIPIEYEEKLWNDNILGESNPQQLRDTVLFLLGINLGLRAVDEHYDLRRSSNEKPSQLSFERDKFGTRCLVYREDCVTKTNDGGIKSLKKERKVVWVHPSKNVNRCPVRLVDKYMSLLPTVKAKAKKMNFYLRGLDNINPAQWYGEQVFGKNSISKVVSNLLKSAKLDGYFTNHSLRRTGATRLFHSGVDRKLIKEFTGHTSDAIDKYETTSDTQRCQISKVVQGQKDEQDENDEGFDVVKAPEPSLELCVKNVNKKGQVSMGCDCNKRKVDVNENMEINDMIRNIVSVSRASKAKIKIEIEFAE